MNREIILTFIGASIVMLLLVLFLVLFALLFRKRQFKHKQEKAALQARYAQEMLQTQIEVQNTTLQQIGQELHDNIGQLLSVARINLNILEETEQSQENKEYIFQTNEIIESTINDLRNLTKSLDGDFVKDFGLQESLAHELLRIRKTNKFKTDLTIAGDAHTLGHEKEIVLFRICQEVLNNILKHSKATKIFVNLHYGVESFELSIRDNGVGFAVETAMTKNYINAGAGLRNIRRRTEIIGGNFNLITSLGEGTLIEIQIPVNNF